MEIKQHLRGIIYLQELRGLCKKPNSKMVDYLFDLAYLYRKK